MSKNQFFRVLSFFIFPAIVFLFSLYIGVVHHAYMLYPWIDVPMHFIGGISIAFTVVLFLKFFIEKKWIQIRSKFLFVLFVVALVLLIAVFYEFYEFLLKTLFDVNTQPDVADTMIDLFLGFLGGLFGGIVFRRI